MKEVHFCHANGFPAKVYSPIFENINSANIHSIPILGCSENGVDQGIDSLAEELICEIEKKSDSPVVGIGHSMGGTIVFLAATKRPDLFSDVILLEPVLWGAGRRFVMRAMKRIGLGNVGNPAVRTLKRRNHFSSMEEVRDYFSKKRIFNTMDSRCFEQYMAHGIVPYGKGFRLAIQPNLESSLFNCQLAEFPKEAYSTKGTIVYANNSNTLFPTDVNWLKKKLIGFNFHEVDGGHMFPVENTKVVEQLINNILNGNLKQANS